MKVKIIWDKLGCSLIFGENPRVDFSNFAKNQRRPTFFVWWPTKVCMWKLNRTRHTDRDFFSPSLMLEAKVQNSSPPAYNFQLVLN